MSLGDVRLQRVRETKRERVNVETKEGINLYQTATLAHLAEVSDIKSEMYTVAVQLGKTNNRLAGRLILAIMKLNRSTTQMLSFVERIKSQTPQG